VWDQSDWVLLTTWQMALQPTFMPQKKNQRVDTGSTIETLVIFLSLFFAIKTWVKRPCGPDATKICHSPTTRTTPRFVNKPIGEIL
jgi:hypothetical protein